MRALGADAYVRDVTLSDNGGEGGIAIVDGKLDVISSMLSENLATPILNGGAISARRSSIYVADTLIANNTSWDGAAIRAIQGEATIVRSTVTDTVATSQILLGGAIHSTSAQLTIRDSTISGNRGQNKAGVVASGPTLIADSTFANNTSGIVIWNSGATATITGSVVKDNQSGGIFVQSTNGRALLAWLDSLAMDDRTKAVMAPRKLVPDRAEALMSAPETFLDAARQIAFGALGEVLRPT